jgi:hypothetical protein
VYAIVVDQGQLYTDLMGKFLVRSSKGNSYVMLCYIYDCNYIKVVPMRSRSASEWVKAYDSIHQELTVKGFKPKLQTLDNEASTALKNFFTVNNTAYQLVPHHCLLIPQVSPAHKYPNSHWEIIHPPGETMQYICNLTRPTRLSVTSHSQLLSNAKYKFKVTNYLQTIF